MLPFKCMIVPLLLHYGRPVAILSLIVALPNLVPVMLFTHKRANSALLLLVTAQVHLRIDLMTWVTPGG